MQEPEKKIDYDKLSLEEIEDILDDYYGQEIKGEVREALRAWKEKRKSSI